MHFPPSAVNAGAPGNSDEFDKTHPVKPPYSKDEGWLGYAADEYQKRFGIDFKAGPVHFERMQELVLARNAGIHREDKAVLDEYITKIKKPAFVAEGYAGKCFFVTRDAFVPMIQDCEQFVKWAVAEIQRLRAAKQSAGG